MKRTILLIIIAGWLLIPTGTPDDIITFYLISLMGAQLYAFVLVVLLVAMLYYKINLEKWYQRSELNGGPSSFFATEADQFILATGSAKFILLRCWAISSCLVHTPNRL